MFRIPRSALLIDPRLTIVLFPLRLVLFSDDVGLDGARYQRHEDCVCSTLDGGSEKKIVVAKSDGD